MSSVTSASSACRVPRAASEPHAGAERRARCKALYMRAGKTGSAEFLQCLEAAGYSVETVESALIGLARACAGHESYRLILLDWAGQDVDSSRVIDAMRNAGVRTSVVALVDEPQAQHPAVMAGVDAVINRAGTLSQPTHVLPTILSRLGARSERAGDPLRPGRSTPPFAEIVLSECPRSSPARVRSWVIWSFANDNLTIPEVLALIDLFRSTLPRWAWLRSSAVEEVEVALQRGRLGTLALPPPVRRAVSQLEAETGVGLREAMLAQDVGIDPAHLGRCLCKYTGLPFREWRRGSRLRNAVREVVTSDRRISDVAWSCGWSSPNQFDREFRSRLGTSPRILRRCAQRLFRSTAAVSWSPSSTLSPSKRKVQPRQRQTDATFSR